MGQPLDVLLPTRVRDRHHAHLGGFAESPVVAKRMGERQEIFGLRRDGREFPAEASISRLEVGGRRFFTAVVRDITERKEAERRIAEALERETAARAGAEAAGRRMRFLAEAGVRLSESLERETTLRTLARVAVPALGDWCAVFVREEDGGLRRLAVVHADPAREALARSLEGTRVEPGAVHHPALRAVETRGAVMVEPAPDDVAATLGASDEQRRVMAELGMRSLLVMPLLLRDQVMGALALAKGREGDVFGPEDVDTARELAARAALAVENTRLYGAAQGAIRAREDVLHVVSHDLGNSLSAIVVITTVLLRTLPEDEANAELRKRISGIRDLARRMQRLRQDLLDVASIEGGRLAIEWDRWDPAAVAREALETFAPLAAEKEIALDGEIADALPVLEGDRERVMQVLANLLGNAVKFTPPGGRVTLRVAPEPEDVCFAVVDTGPGIPAEHLGHVFDRFWKVRAANRTGAGLGLAIARGIVEAHDGRIWARSTPGQGATFSFTLPLRPEMEDEELWEEEIEEPV
jgi:signal transduction histidine kinase